MCVKKKKKKSHDGSRARYRRHFGVSYIIVPPSDVTGVKWLKKHNNVYTAVSGAILPTRLRLLYARSFGGSRLCATPRALLKRLSAKPRATNSLGRGLVEREHALLAENALSTELPTGYRLPYSSTPSHQPPAEHKSYNIDSTDYKKTRRIQSRRAVLDWRNPTV